MNFEFVGKISMGKESEKFKPYEEAVVKDIYKRKRLKFNVACAGSRHFLQVESFNSIDENDPNNRVLVFSKGSDGAKGEKFYIPFKDRLTSPELDNVAEFKKFVVDLGDRDKRYKLKRLVDKISNKEVITDEELESVGCENEAAVKKAYENNMKMHKEFIAETDFIDFIKKLIDSGKYADKKFKIRGNAEYAYSERDNIVYGNYIPQKIYLVDDNEPEVSTANLLFLFGAESLNKDYAPDKYMLSGWTMSYDRMLKKNIPVGINVVINATDKDKADKIAKRFEAMGDEIKEMGIAIDVIDGSTRVEITEDMLSDEQKELLDLGFTTMDELRAELGGSARGESIREFRLKSFTKGYTNGAKDTVWNPSDMVIKTEEDNIDDDLASLFDQD